MRIISGLRKGHPLQVPKSDLRPTTDLTREAIFNILESRIDFTNILVLDLFSGSGALGLEALSRGARQATLVEQSSEAVRTIRSNVETLGFKDQCVIVRDDVFRFLKRQSDTFDLIFADPPYELEQIPILVERVPEFLSEGGLFVLEHDRAHDFGDHPDLLVSRTYGRSVVSLFALP